MIEFFLAFGIVLFVAFLRISPTNPHDMVVLAASIMSLVVAGALAALRYLNPKDYRRAK